MDRFFESFGVVFAIGLFAFGIFQIWLGFVGIENQLGIGFAIGAIAVALIFRIMLPMTIGAYFGAVNVMGWPVIVGILCALPGLIFIVPGLVAFVTEGIFRKR